MGSMMKRIPLLAAALFLFVAPVPAGAAQRPYVTGGAVGEKAVTLEAGHSAQVTLTFKNTGHDAWQSGKHYVSAYATSPYPRRSVFRDASWPTAYQVARLKEAVVKPGETGTLTLTLHAPQMAGTYSEAFSLAVENTAWIRGSNFRLAVNVIPEQVTVATPVYAKSSIVMDAETGQVLSSQDADSPHSIASMTKLMTVMVTHEAGVDPNRIITLGRDDEVGGGRLRVRYGTKVSVNDLVASAIIGSANNAANALARATGLSQEEFVQRMDHKAAELGLTNTQFADPTGIEVPNVSTAREVALMGKAAFNDPWISQFAGTPLYTVQTSFGPHDIRNTNKLVFQPGIDVVAGKTGFIYEAGYTLVTRLRRAGRHDLMVVVMGCDSSAGSFRDARILAEKAWLTDATVALAR